MKVKSQFSERLPTAQELIEEFADLPDFDDRVDYIIDLGRELPKATDDLHAEQNLVQGCMSTVWLRMQVGDAGQGPAARGAGGDGSRRRVHRRIVAQTRHGLR